jgi:hypothetical protein
MTKALNIVERYQCFTIVVNCASRPLQALTNLPGYILHLYNPPMACLFHNRGNNVQYCVLLATSVYRIAENLVNCVMKMTGDIQGQILPHFQVCFQRMVYKMHLVECLYIINRSWNI